MKVLILGAAGMLGHQVWLKCIKAFGPENVAGTLRKARSHYDRFEIFSAGTIFDGLDVLDFSQVEKKLNSFRPDYVINCIGLTLRKEELGNIEKCIEINSMLPHRLSIWAEKNQSRVVHFSTDCVFNGKRGNYSEDDFPTAEDLYGKSKFLGEIAGTRALTLRLSIVGRELEGKTELLEWFLSQSGKAVSGYSKVFYSGLTTNFVADEVIRILTKFPALHGVYQVSSEPISKFELLQTANELFQAKVEIMETADYVSDKTLSSDRYSRATGFVSPSWASMLKDLAADRSVNYGV